MNDKICLNSHTIKENEIWYAVKHINKNIRMNSRSGGGCLLQFLIMF